MTRVSTAAAVFAALFAVTPCRALAPDRRLTQLHHTGWSLENGAPPDIWALAQSADGFLWLGTGAGLFRFDGLRFEAVQPASGRLASRNITALLAAADGSLWIGSYDGAISRLRKGQFEAFDVPQVGSVQQFAEGLDGTIWAALAGSDGGGLARFDGREWSLLDAGWGVPATRVYSVLAARNGAIWAAGADRILVLLPGARRFQSIPEPARRARLLQAPDGRIWLSGDVRGAAPLSAGPDGAPTVLPLPPGAIAPITDRAIFDRDGSVWESSTAGGIVRIVDPGGSGAAANGIERFTAAQGLTSDVAVPMVEDREGDIWVGTNLGLDRFRAANAVTAIELPKTIRGGFQATTGAGDTMFVSAGRTLYRIDGDRAAIVAATLPAIPTLLQADGQGSLVIGLPGGLFTLNNGRLAPFPGPPDEAGEIDSWTRDAAGVDWVTIAGAGVFRHANGAWQRFAALGDARLTPVLRTVSGPGGGTWFYAQDRAFLRQGHAFESFGERQGLAVGRVNVIDAAGGQVLVGGDDGIARFAAGRFRTLSSARVPALNRVTGIVRADGAVWANGIKGVVRIPERALDAAFQDSAKPVTYDLFDVTDGLPGVAQQDHGTPTAAAFGDGRVWLVDSYGVAWIDAAHLARNKVPPSVVIRDVVAQGKDHPFPTSLTLSAGISALQIDYTATSLSKPEQVGFRYRLDGVDDGWIDADGRRQAFYTKLAPGRYRFQVVARNSDGVWNTAGAAVAITIPPTFVQSTPFMLLCGLAAAGLLWLIWSVRMGRTARRLRERYEVRLAERERIARELHDTLLQGFGGLMLRFQAAAADLTPGHASRAHIDGALELGETILREGRSRIVDLREPLALRDIPQSLAAAAERLALEPRTKMRVTVEGESRALTPIVAEEIARLAEEAIANVQRHANARRLEAGITYGDKELRVCIRDDGVGIDGTVVAQGGRSEHYGLRGMRERAERISGRLTVQSAPGAGTAILLSVPASVAYAKVADRRPHRWPARLAAWAHR